MAKTNTKLTDYTEKYGEEEGTRRFNLVLKARAKREASVVSGRSNYGKKVVLTAADITNGGAVECLECKAVMPRIQWTHLKKCSSMSLDEYRTKHPNAELVATNLKKKCAVTRENLVELYGDVGVDKFDHYREKQADSNSFEYKAEKYGMTREEFDEYNASRATTRDNLIARHGEEKGTQMWESYVERQRYTTSLDYFIAQYGEEDGTEKYKAFCIERNFKNRKESIAEREIYTALVEAFPYIEAQVGFTGMGHYKPYDIGCHKKKKIIEYFGDYWHANPHIYDKVKLIKQKGKTAEEVWEHDSKKLKFAESMGYSVMVIWEKDWKENRDAELAKAIAFLS